MQRGTFQLSWEPKGLSQLNRLADANNVGTESVLRKAVLSCAKVLDVEAIACLLKLLLNVQIIAAEAFVAPPGWHVLHHEKLWQPGFYETNAMIHELPGIRVSSPLASPRERLARCASKVGVDRARHRCPSSDIL